MFAGCTVIDEDVIDLDQPASTRGPAYALLRSADAMDAAVTADLDRYEAVIADNEKALRRPAIWRMRSEGLARR